MSVRSKDDKSMAIIKFLFPIASGIGGSALFLLSVPKFSSKLLPLMAAYFFPPMGKESVIPIGIANGIPPSLMVFSIVFMDTMAGLFMVWNYDNIKYIPVIGRKLYGILKKSEEKGRKIAKRYKWIKSLEFIGIVLFVMIPFQGTGAVGASIVGRIIGMKPWRVWIATIIGSTIGSALIAYGSEIFWILAHINVILSIVFLIVVGIVFYTLLKSLRVLER